MDGIFWTSAEDFCQLPAVTGDGHAEPGPRLCICSHADVRPRKRLCNSKVSIALLLSIVDNSCRVLVT